MSKHKSEDYKLSAVKYYLNNNVCEILPHESIHTI